MVLLCCRTWNKKISLLYKWAFLCISHWKEAFSRSQVPVCHISFCFCRYVSLLHCLSTTMCLLQYLHHTISTTLSLCDNASLSHSVFLLQSAFTFSLLQCLPCSHNVSLPHCLSVAVTQKHQQFNCPTCYFCLQQFWIWIGHKWLLVKLETVGRAAKSY